MNPAPVLNTKAAARPSTFNQLFRFHSTLVASLAVLVALFCHNTIEDPDIWWHLENARRFVSNWHFATRDVYSFTALNSPWMNHEWLSELPLYYAYRAFGAQGIFGMTLLMAELIVMGTFYLGYKESDNAKGAFLYGILGVLLSIVNFGPRTILFGWCCLMILLRVLQRIRAGQSGPWWAIPILFGVWVNTHGSWLIGLVVSVLIVAPGFFQLDSDWVDNHYWNPKQRKEFIFAGLLTIPALLCNPYGYRLVFYPFDLAFRQKLNVSHVEEWMSVDFHTSRGRVAFAMILVVLASLALSRLRPYADELLLTVFALYTSLTHIRFLLLAAILLAPMVVRRMTFLPPYEPEIDKPKLNAMIVAGVLLTIVLRFPSEVNLRSGLSKIYPDQAIAYLKQHAPHSRVFNEYTWGGYLMWTTPELPTFIDSRTDIFEYNGTLGDYLDIMSCDRSLELLDKQRIDYVLIRPKMPLGYLLAHTNGWRLSMSGEQGDLFERTQPLQTSKEIASPN